MDLTNKIRKLLTLNWRPKLICLLLAVLVWVWVEFFYVRDENKEWDMDDIRLSLPE